MNAMTALWEDVMGISQTSFIHAAFPREKEEMGAHGNKHVSKYVNEQSSMRVIMLSAMICPDVRGQARALQLFQLYKLCVRIECSLDWACTVS